MGEHVTKGVLATFGVYETDIHELKATAATAGVKWSVIGQFENVARKGDSGRVPSRQAAKKTVNQRDIEEDARRSPALPLRPFSCTFGTALTTADELANAYKETGWKQSERAEFASRIRALEGKGRAAARVGEHEDEDPLEPLTETTARLGKVWDLLIAWLEVLAGLHPEARPQVADAARGLKRGLPEERLPGNRSAQRQLDVHIRRTRSEAQRLVEKLEAEGEPRAHRSATESTAKDHT